MKIIEKLEKNEAFEVITSEINACEDKYITKLMAPLNFLKYDGVLDWIEQNAKQTDNITHYWGHLSASSNFSWERAEN